MNFELISPSSAYVSKKQLKALIYEDELLNIYKYNWQDSCYQLWRDRFFHADIVEPSIFWLSQFVKPHSEQDYILRFRIYSLASVYILVRDRPGAAPLCSLMTLMRDNPRKVIYGLCEDTELDLSVLDGLSLGALIHESDLKQAGIPLKAAFQ